MRLADGLEVIIDGQSYGKFDLERGMVEIDVPDGSRTLCVKRMFVRSQQLHLDANFEERGYRLRHPFDFPEAKFDDVSDLRWPRFLDILKYTSVVVGLCLAQALLGWLDGVFGFEPQTISSVLGATFFVAIAVLILHRWIRPHLEPIEVA